MRSKQQLKIASRARAPRRAFIEGLKQIVIVRLIHLAWRLRKPLWPGLVIGLCGGVGLLGWVLWPMRWPFGILIGLLPLFSSLTTLHRPKWQKYYYWTLACIVSGICTILWVEGPSASSLVEWVSIGLAMWVVWIGYRYEPWRRVYVSGLSDAGMRGYARAWWYGHRMRRRWHDLGLEGRIRSVYADDHGYTLHLIAPGTVLRDIDVERWESRLDLDFGQMRVTQSKKANHFNVRIVTHDPLAVVLSYPGSDVTTVRNAVRLGLFENGRDARILIPGTHLLVAGVTGSGKSSVLNAMLAELAWCDDAEIWGVDLKGGMELGPWRDRLSRLEVSIVGAEALLEDLIHAIESRMHTSRQRGKKKWYATARDPQIVVVMDEVARLSKRGLELLEEVSMIGRALGVTLICATQQPSCRVLGSTVLRSQMTTRIGLRVGEVNEIGMIFDKGMAGQGWRLDRLTQPGSFLLYDSENHRRPVPARCWLIEEDEVREIVEQTARLRPGRPQLRALEG